MVALKGSQSNEVITGGKARQRACSVTNEADERQEMTEVCTHVHPMGDLQSVGGLPASLDPQPPSPR
ncbi:hypothetical protein ACOMHN_004951 [Nucella lapillus]